MNCTSYLLPIDGSAESQLAAHFAWDLAERTGARVVAQHVVDSAGIWRFLSHAHAGFVGSGLYMDAREKMIAIMQSLGESLTMSYSSQAEGQDIKTETHIDDGDPAVEIARRAKEHDLVILGYKQRTSAEPGIFEQLLETCSCPILIVRNTTKAWSKLQIFVTSDIAGSESISDLYHLGTMLGLPIEVYLDPDARTIDADPFTVGGWSTALGVRSIQRGKFSEMLKAACDDALVVVSKSSASNRKSTRFLTLLKQFIDQSDQRAVLFWDADETIETVKRLDTSKERNSRQSKLRHRTKG